MANRGQEPVRVDPRDFELLAGDKRWQVDAEYTGPPARSLLHRASVNLVVTFQVPIRDGVSLLYSPDWHRSGIVLEGMQAPLGERSVEVSEK